MSVNIELYKDLLEYHKKLSSKYCVELIVFTGHCWNIPSVIPGCMFLVLKMSNDAISYPVEMKVLIVSRAANPWRTLMWC